MVTQKQVWRDIPDYEGLYQVSDKGNVRSIKTSDIKGRLLRPIELSQHPNTQGYYSVVLTKDRKRTTWTVHRLVALTFMPDGVNEQVNHLNGRKKDNRLSNLEWCTQGQNLSHASRTGLFNTARGERAGHSKLTDDLVNWLRVVYIKQDKEFGVMGLSRKLKLSPSVISEAIRGVSWSHV